MVEANGLSLAACLFKLVIWADGFVLLQCDFLGKIVGVGVVMEVVVVEAVNMVQANFCLFEMSFFGEDDGARLMIEVVLAMMVLVW